MACRLLNPLVRRLDELIGTMTWVISVLYIYEPVNSSNTPGDWISDIRDQCYSYGWEADYKKRVLLSGGMGYRQAE